MKKHTWKRAEYDHVKKEAKKKTKKKTAKRNHADIRKLKKKNHAT
jgi:hypothetical protein